MITRNKDVNSSNEMKILAICCEEVIEQQIIPELSLIYSTEVNSYHDFIKYIYLIENVIKSAAIIQQLRYIENNLLLDQPSSRLTEEINALKQQQNLATKYNNIFDLYYHDQTPINTFLTTAKSLYSHHTYIADLQYIIGLAHKGMSYATHVAQYNLPATYYCYTKQFNAQLSQFLQNIINDMFDDYNKVLYKKYDALPISEEAFSSVIMSIAFRIQLAVNFIEHYYSSQELIEENSHIEAQQHLDSYFLQLVGKIRNAAFSG